MIAVLTFSMMLALFGAQPVAAVKRITAMAINERTLSRVMFFSSSVDILSICFPIISIYTHGLISIS